MQRRRARPADRPLPEIAYLILGHVAAERDGVHGYLLGRRLAASPLGIPTLRLDQVYRILRDLAVRGLVAHRIEAGGSRPSRQLFTITRAGSVRFHRWLAGPPRGSEPVREQLLRRLRFGDLLPPATLRRLVREAMRECDTDLVDIRAAGARPNGTSAGGTRLLSTALERRLAADLSWLAEVEQAAAGGRRP